MEKVDNWLKAELGIRALDTQIKGSEFVRAPKDVPVIVTVCPSFKAPFQVTV